MRKVKKVKPKPTKVFNSGLEFDDDLIVAVPYRLLEVMRAISKKIRGLEFAILSRGSWISGGVFELEDDYIIPEQEVTISSVEMTEHPGGDWNVFIHHHPPGVNDWSQTDWDHLLPNWEVNLLEEKGMFVAARVKVKTPGGWAILPAKIELVEPPAIEVEGLERIKVKKNLNRGMGPPQIGDTIVVPAIKDPFYLGE